MKLILLPLIYGPASAEDRGKFVLALRRAAGGQWLIAADIDQSNRF